MKHQRRIRRSTIWKFALLFLVVCIIVFRLFLPTIAKHYVNRELNRDPLYHGHVESVGIHLWRGAYSLHGLDIRRVAGTKDFPLVSAEKVDIGVTWKELVHRTIRMKLDVRNLVVNIVQEKEHGKKKVEVGRPSKEGKKKEAGNWKTAFKKLVPIDVNRLTIEGHSLHFRDLSVEPKFDFYIDHLLVHGENLTNSAKVSKNLFGTIDLRGRAMESGNLHVVLYMNPFASPPQFKVTTTLDNLDLTRLNPFFKAYGHFDIKSGSIGIYSEVATSHNEVKGYIKPIIHHLSVADLKKDVKRGGILHAAWEAVVGAIGGILKSHQKHQQAARIQIAGRLDQPNTSGWQIAKSVLYNAFVKPIKPGTSNTVNLAAVDKQGKKGS